MSTEMEYGVDAERLSDGDVESCLPHDIFAIRTFLSNGGRLYADMGSKIEYAAPECAGAIEAAHAEFAGEQIALMTHEELIERHVVPPYPTRKCVADIEGNSWGYHENYQMKRSTYDSRSHVPFLAAHFATRSELVGAGFVDLHGEYPRVFPSQKIIGIRELLGSSSTHSKALVNTRDEPHSNKNKWARQHVVCGDPNISLETTVLKLGSTSLVLRLAETGLGKPRPIQFADPLQAAHFFGNDTTGNKKFINRDGKLVSALDVQEVLLEQCEDLSERFELPADETKTLQLWRNRLDVCKFMPDESRKVIEHRAKRELIEHKLARWSSAGCDQSKIQNKLWNLIMAWDDVRSSICVGRRWMRVQEEELYDDDLIEELIYYPPQSTRAKARGDFIWKNHREAERDEHSRMNWDGGGVFSKSLNLPTARVKRKF